MSASSVTIERAEWVFTFGRRGPAGMARHWVSRYLAGSGATAHSDGRRVPVSRSRRPAGRSVRAQASQRELVEELVAEAVTDAYVRYSAWRASHNPRCVQAAVKCALRRSCWRAVIDHFRRPTTEPVGDMDRLPKERMLWGTSVPVSDQPTDDRLRRVLKSLSPKEIETVLVLIRLCSGEREHSQMVGSVSGSELGAELGVTPRAAQMRMKALRAHPAMQDLMLSAVFGGHGESDTEGE